MIYLFQLNAGLELMTWDLETGLDHFVDLVADAGVNVVYLHARKALLKGLSPKKIGIFLPLDYDRADVCCPPDRSFHYLEWRVSDGRADKCTEIADFVGVMIRRSCISNSIF